MPPIPKKYKLSSLFPFLDNRKKEDNEIFKKYNDFREWNGNKSHPQTIRDMITKISHLLDFHKERMLLSIEYRDGYNIEVIDTTTTKGDKRET